MKDNITVPTGKVVAIGKIKVFKTDTFLHSIPTLSFIVAKGDDGLFTASCMQLLLDCSSSDEMGCVRGLVNECKDFLETLFNSSPDKVDAWSELHEWGNSPIAIPYWNAYRDVQYNLSERGVDMKSSYERYLEARIKELNEELKMYRKTRPHEIGIDIVDYNEAA